MWCLLCPVIGTDVFEVEKPLVFTYEDILSATDGFSESNLLGHGTYGSVYYGLLKQDQVCYAFEFANVNIERLINFMNRVNMLEISGSCC